jgi:hypothetical protein
MGQSKFTGTVEQHEGRVLTRACGVLGAATRRFEQGPEKDKPVRDCILQHAHKRYVTFEQGGVLFAGSIGVVMPASSTLRAAYTGMGRPGT